MAYTKNTRKALSTIEDARISSGGGGGTGADVQLGQIMLKDGVQKFVPYTFSGTTPAEGTAETFQNLYTYNTVNPVPTGGGGATSFYKCASVGRTGSFRYIKICFLGIRESSNDSTQLSEWKFWSDYAHTSAFSYPSGTTVIADSGAIYPQSESPSNIIDGDTSTKYYTSNWSANSYVIIDLGQGNTIDMSVYKYYGYYTANDYDGRDPVSWQILGSNDGSTWTACASVNNETITTDRLTIAGVWELNSLPSDGTWGGYKAVWNSVSGQYEYEASLTTDTLSCTNRTPDVGKTYSSNALISAILWEGMPTDGLVFHAPLKSNEPNTKLGNPLGYHGTINISSDGALFTDRNSYIQSMIGFSNCSECTISCWIYMDDDAGGSSSDYPRFMCLGTDISKQYDYANDWFTLTYSKDIGKIKVQVPDCGNWPGEGITFQRNQFFHFAGVISGNTIIPYLNGTAQTSATMSNTFMLPNYATLYINQVRANYGIDGVRIADARVYNRALSAQEIATLASEFTPTVNA